MAVKTVKVDLPAEIFDVEVNVPLIHQVVVAQQAAARQGTHSTKSRGEVRGGGRKPHKQKGTGRARQGSTRAPQFAGGGIVHGPQPRSYDQRTPKKMKAAALRGALSDRARNDRVHVVDALVSGDKPSTKAALASLERKKASLDDLVALSTITVSLIGPHTPLPEPEREPAPGFLGGLEAGWDAFVGTVQVALAVLGFLLPFLIALAIPVALVIALRRRRPAVASTASPAATTPPPAPTSD